MSEAVQDKFDIVEALSHSSDEEIATIIACAKFQKYLQQNYGKKIDLSTIAEFAELAGKLLDLE